MNAHVQTTTGKPRTRNHNGHLVFVKHPDGRREITFPQFRTGMWGRIEIVPVGRGRYALLPYGKLPVFLEKHEVLPALQSFRKAAAMHREDWQAFERSFG